MPYSGFQGGGDFDLALCVFTVILYLLDEVSLRQSFENVFNSLRADGRLFLDIPTKAAFGSYEKKTTRMYRKVRVESLSGDLFQYSEQTRFDGVDYFDTFQIRYWNEEYILDLLGEIGFTLDLDLRNRFAGTGSSYFLFEKTAA